MRQRVRHRLLPRIASVNHARGPPQSRFRYFVFQEDDVIGARRNEKIGDGCAGGETAQRENDQRHAVQFEELLRLFGAHAGAESSGGNNGSDSAHRSETVYRTPSHRRARLRETKQQRVCERSSRSGPDSG